MRLVFSVVIAAVPVIAGAALVEGCVSPTCEDTETCPGGANASSSSGESVGTDGSGPSSSVASSSSTGSGGTPRDASTDTTSDVSEMLEAEADGATSDAPANDAAKEATSDAEPDGPATDAMPSEASAADAETDAVAPVDARVDSPEVDSAPEQEAGADATVDAGNGPPEAGTDAGNGPPDTGSPPADAGMEAAAPTCSTSVPSTPTIIGTSVSPSWITYTYESSGQSEATVSTTSSGLNVAASVVPESGQIYVGAGVAFNSTSCIDASAYNGISFKLSGSLGTCSILFYVQDVEDTSSMAYPRRGVCTAGACYGPSFEVTTTGTFTVPFSQMMAGTPRGPIDPTQITSVQWQLTLPESDAGGCSANYTLSNVAFVDVDGG